MMRKRNLWIVIVVVLCAVLAGCVSYDSPVLYKKNFQPLELLTLRGWKRFTPATAAAPSR